MCCCHRTKATLECGYEIRHGPITNPSMGNDGTDCRKRILHTMVELGNQGMLALFCAFAFGDIDDDADYPSWIAIAAVRNEAARLDPSNLAGAQDAVFHAVLTPSLAECLTSERIYSFTVFWESTALPCAERTFLCSFR